MIDEQHINDSKAQEEQTSLDRFFEHIQAVTDGVQNLQWEEVEFHLSNLETIVGTADASEKPYIDALYEPIRNFVLGFQQLVTAKAPEDQEKALNRLTGARSALRKVRTEQRELTDNPGFVQFGMGIESQILSLQSQIATRRGDSNEAARLDQQRNHLLDDMIAGLEPDNPLRHFFVGLKLYQEALLRFNRGMQALLEMNLDLAQQYLEESSQNFSVMRDHLNEAKINALMFKALKNAMEGFGLLVSGQDIYVRALRAAIIGDVNRVDILALEKAERSFLDGGDLISTAVQAVPALFNNLDIKPTTRQLSQLTHNFRTLCERSLSPKQITRATAPKVIFYFLGTFLVLLFGLPISGLVRGLQSKDIFLLVIVSVLVSVIGAFGFEAVRLVPLFEVFTRMLPGGSRPQKDDGKEAPAET
jgi:hypothetical protein